MLYKSILTALQCEQVFAFASDLNVAKKSAVKDSEQNIYLQICKDIVSMKRENGMSPYF